MRKISFPVLRVEKPNCFTKNFLLKLQHKLFFISVMEDGKFVEESNEFQNMWFLSFLESAYSHLLDFLGGIRKTNIHLHYENLSCINSLCFIFLSLWCVWVRSVEPNIFSHALLVYLFCLKCSVSFWITYSRILIKFPIFIALSLSTSFPKFPKFQYITTIFFLDWKFYLNQNYHFHSWMSFKKEKLKFQILL